MMLLFAIVFFIFGTIIGSFLNVLVLRYNTGLSIVSGRSQCFVCGKTLRWYELVPLFSFIFLGGRCASCKSRISWQYPTVEAATGALFVLSFLKFGISPATMLYLCVSSILVAVSVYDFKHKIIPDGMVFLFDAAALLFFFLSHTGVASAVLAAPDFWAGPILFAFFAFFWLVSGGKWMGLGDAKLSLGVGWCLGLSGGVFAIMLAFWIGAAVSLFLLGLERLNLSRFRLTMKSEVPFAPFIIVAFFLTLFSGWNLSLIMNFAR